jgi:hypothetical protein
MLIGLLNQEPFKTLCFARTPTRWHKWESNAITYRINQSQLHWMVM